MSLYYIKEFDSADNTDIAGHYIYSNNNYNNTQLHGTEKPFELADNNTEANLTEGVKNTLRQTKHEVVKVWDDKDQPENRADYTISLQRKKINETNWVDVDLNDVKCSTIEKVQGSNDKITEITGIADNTSDYAVDMSKLHLSFEELPLYDKDGLKYEYRVVEKKIGSYNVIDNNTYLFFVPGTQATDDDFSYVRTVRRGTNNYYVDYDFEDTKSTITNSVVTDTVAHSNFEATKIWDDENNVYGIRPESITFVLKRTKNGVLDGSFSSPKTVTSKENWHCIWEHCAAFAPDGGEFDYFVEEEPIANYSTTVQIDDTNNPKTRTYTFTNSYTPPKKTLTAKKTWDDQSNNFGLRPASITFDLYCKYDNYDGLVYDSTKTDDEQSAVYKKRGGSSADFSKTVTVDNTAHTTEVEFTDLPACVNPTGTATANGQAYSVTYYYKESFGNDENNTLYKKLYQCGNTNDNCTSEEKSLFMTANEGSSITPVEGTYTVTPAINYANNGMIYFLIKNQPLMDNNGFAYTYNVTSSDGFTSMDSPFGSSAGKKSLLISKNVSSIDNETPGAASYSFTVTRSKTVTNTEAVTDAAGTGITVTNSANGIYSFTVPANTASNTPVSVTLNVLPLADNDSHIYTYTVKECDDKGHEYGSSTNFTSTINNGVITVTKTLSDSPTADYTVYFKLSRSVQYNVTENLTDAAVNITLSDASSGSPNTGGIFDKNGILTNTLETRDIIVAKSWEDNDYMKGETNATNVLNGMHYHTKMTLSCSALPSTAAGRSSSGHYYEESKIITNTDKNGVRFLSLPKYGSSGNVLEYSLKEEVFTPTAQDPLPTFATSPEDETFTSYCQISDAYNADENDADFAIDQDSTEYGYYGSCKVKKGSDDVVTQYNVLNTLPLTALTVEKTWDDQNNEFGFRPDSLTLDLKEEAVASNELSTLTKATMSGWAESVWEAPQYSTHDSGDNKFPVKNGNMWTYTYKKLLKFDKDNNPYVFRITETKANSEYLDPSYTTRYISDVDAANKTTDGTTALTEKFDITNTLDTRDVTVNKTWDDNGYGNSLHYDLDITLSSNAANNGAYNSENHLDPNDSTSAAVNRNASSKYKETKTIVADGTGVTFYKLPKYDTSGNVIVYNVREDAHSHNSPVAAAISRTAAKESSSAYTLTTAPAFVDGDRHYGYVGSAEYTASQEIAGKPYATQFDIKNELQLTDVIVTKTWVDQNNVFGIRPGRVTYSLKRTTNASLAHNDSSGWEDVTTSIPTVLSPANTFTEKYTDLLMYAENNDPYYFKVDETAVNGYTTTYPTAITTKTSKALAVTNTMDTIDIIAAKHWDDQGYSNGNDLHYHYNVKVTLASDDVTIPNDKTELVINKTDNSGVKFISFPKTNGSGKTIVYSIFEAATDDAATTGENALTNAYKNEGTATTTLFTVSSQRYGYVGSCKLKTETNDNMQFNIVNQLPVVSFTAHKDWADDSNRDGKRPSSLDFTLKQDGNLIDTKTATPDGWNVDFGLYLKCKENNTNYDYLVEEADFTNKSSDYTSEVKTETINTISDHKTNYHYNFTNTKTTQYKGNLTASKKWDGDETYKDDTRPASVQVKLMYSIDGGTTINDASTESAITDFVGSGYQFTRTLENSNSWQTDFENLPLYINKDGKDKNNPGTDGAQPNGTYATVKYYIQEIGAGTGNLTGYESSYGESAITKTNKAYNQVPVELQNGGTKNINVINTLKTKDITVYKEWNNSACVEATRTNDPYNVTVQISSSDVSSYNPGNMTIPAGDSDGEKFTGVPEYKKDGTAAQYTVSELLSSPGLKKYGYVPDYKINDGSYSSSCTFDITTTSSVTVRNTLPTTQIIVTKHWFDKFDNLDYSSFRQTVQFKLYRSTDGSTWTEVSTSNYTLTEDKTTHNADNYWTYTFSGLLRYDESNTFYQLLPMRIHILWLSIMNCVLIRLL